MTDRNRLSTVFYGIDPYIDTIPYIYYIMKGVTMEEKIIVCKDCGKEFVFTVGEQEFYKQHGFSEPKRCRDCRQKRKE